MRPATSFMSLTSKSAVLVLFSLLPTLAVQASDFSGTWKGAYDCDEITRQIRLELVASGGNVYSGMVSFSAGDELGQFAVRGATSPDAETIIVEPSGWIDRPEGYAMVGFKARIHDDVMFGTMSNDRCGAIYVSRLVPPGK